MSNEYQYIFYKNDNESGYDVIKVRTSKESCEKYCKEKGLKNYKVLYLYSLEAHNLHLVTDIVYYNNKYYFPEDKIPYPKTEPSDIGKFQSSFIWNQEYANTDDDFEEAYKKLGFNRGFGYLWTEITTKFILPNKTIELAPIAQEIVIYFSEFLDKLEKENYAIYVNAEYSCFKWLAWINGDKVRIIHQNYEGEFVKDEFDVLLDKDWFFQFGHNMVKTMQEYADADLKRFKKNYVIKKYGRIDKESISYPETEPLNIGKFEIRLEQNNDNESYFEDFYKTKDELYTSIYAYLDLKNKTEEVILIAEHFSKYFPGFIEELKQIENSTYIDMDYTETKLYAWIKDDNVRLVYQDFSSDEQEIIFDVMVDKTWFFETADNLIKQLRDISALQKELYEKYINEKHNN